MNSRKAIFNFHKFEPYVEADTFLRIFSKLNYPFAIMLQIFGLILIIDFVYDYLNSHEFNISDIKYFIGACIFYYICRYHSEYSKNDRVVMLLVFYFLFRFGVSFAFILGGMLMHNDNNPSWQYPLLLGLCWFPSLEFIRYIRLNFKNIFVYRLVIAVCIIYFWYKSGMLF